MRGRRQLDRLPSRQKVGDSADRGPAGDTPPRIHDGPQDLQLSADTTTWPTCGEQQCRDGHVDDVEAVYLRGDARVDLSPAAASAAARQFGVVLGDSLCSRV